jgi:membrane fusion protein (multidrug efflux system)
MDSTTTTKAGVESPGKSEPEVSKPGSPPPTVAALPSAKPAHPLRRLAIVLAAIVVLVFAAKLIHEALTTVSTDDAYVNSHVTFVAPRVAGQVAQVLVDDNNRVKKGDILVVLDKEPFQVQVNIKKAALDVAQANLVAEEATIRGQIAAARSARFKLLHTIEDVDNQVALLRANVAALEKAKASLDLAQKEFDRYKQLLATKVASKEEFDKYRTSLDASIAAVNQANENVIQTRVTLGLPATPANGKPLTDVPADLGQTFSSVQQAEADLLNAAAQLGITGSSYKLTPKEVIAEFYRRDPSGDIDKIYDKVMKDAPGLKQAQTKVMEAQRDLDNANLNLRYCDIVSEIDGVVTNRNVNPGNNVQVGQSLMAVRSLTEVWVDCNFKETQLRSLRIGQPVDLETDMYGGHYTFKGRISGFTNGTGSTLALLPAENATGNFIKVVQRLPVRVDLVDYNPDQPGTPPLFVGLSVEPKVHIKEQPTGPDAGKFLQVLLPLPTANPDALPITPATPATSATPAPIPAKP